MLRENQDRDLNRDFPGADGGFWQRHIGPDSRDVQEMLAELGFATLDDFVRQVIPEKIRLKRPLAFATWPEAFSEIQALKRLVEIASANEVWRSYIGMGYSGTLTPPVILRNILENPGWYTQYTPYQAEISQGRLEALLNFQTMVSDLTGLPVANASLLDEGTAAAEAMTLSLAVWSKKAGAGAALRYLVSSDCHPQTVAVIKTRAEALGVEVLVSDPASIGSDAGCFGALFQYPASCGAISDCRDQISRLKESGALVTMACDILALALLAPPGELGADIAVGSTQRFGVPMGFGGPHAAYFAVRDEFKRLVPGRIVGVSKDADGNPAIRLALQTREQHIRREKATSNICTAQVLLAVMAGMYAVYHGPEGLRRIARRVNQQTALLASGVKLAGFKLVHDNFFDTLAIRGDKFAIDQVLNRARERQINLRQIDDVTLGVALDESTSDEDLEDLLYVFSGERTTLSSIKPPLLSSIPEGLQRRSEFLQHEVFSRYHSETEFLRYLKRLEVKDLSLCQSMIPLGSCTMKLNATAEMLALSWGSFALIHPFAPASQTRGYQVLFRELEDALCEITGFTAVSLQPNAGSQGEYAGLMVIRAWHRQRGQGARDICLIPSSAHGTNPASAVMAGFKVVPVKCDSLGNIDLSDLKERCAEHKDRLAALMVTYPSTHGVFEEAIKEICEAVHQSGAQVYMDGANLNAMVGLVRPAELGADVCHINLHKTFAIPHGGGGPGMGPIAVAGHLAPYLPGHPLAEPAHEKAIGPVSAAPWGSASILSISWAYMALMGADGLKRASEIAILNANYVASKLKDAYPVVYSGKSGFVAHECILDMHGLKSLADIDVDDVAKRLMDYGFHAPTVAWPVHGTLMFEPTESESKAELDRFVEAMLLIYEEAGDIASGKLDRSNNPLKRAPHTALQIASDSWDRPYSRERAAFPAAFTRRHKFWPAAARIDAAYGDRNLICSCG